MRLKSIRLQNIRNHTTFSCDFSSSVNVIHGKNGAGKTSILEAIYAVYCGTSFRGTDSDILAVNETWFRIDTDDDLPYSRSIIFDNRTGSKTKKITIDDKTFARLPQRFRRPIVLFTPRDLQLIDGSPARRRDYLDRIITQLNPQYGTALRRYERALLQRNKLLKQHVQQPDSYFPWNVILSETGAMIMDEREKYIAKINETITAHYQDIAPTSDIITVQHSQHAATSSELLHQYDGAFQHDSVTGSTSIGPHRHDMTIAINQRPAADVASRGEIRTIIIALKYIEANALRERFQDIPLVLLDDVYGELDSVRRQNMTHTLRENQIIVTSTDKISGVEACHIEL